MQREESLLLKYLRTCIHSNNRIMLTTHCQVKKKILIYSTYIHSLYSVCSIIETATINTACSYTNKLIVIVSCILSVERGIGYKGCDLFPNTLCLCACVCVCVRQRRCKKTLTTEMANIHFKLGVYTFYVTNNV